MPGCTGPFLRWPLARLIDLVPGCLAVDMWGKQLLPDPGFYGNRGKATHRKMRVCKRLGDVLYYVVVDEVGLPHFSFTWKRFAR